MKNKVKLVGALSPVNHKGLHQGWIQTSLFLQVIHFASRHTTSQVFLAYLYSARTQEETCLWQGDLFYSVGLHMNHVLATANTRKIGRGSGKNAGEWTGRVEISQEETRIITQETDIQVGLPQDRKTQ